MATHKETKMVKESRPMVGGDGPNSYAQNSSYQKEGADVAKELVCEGIKKNLDFKNPNFDKLTTFTVADLGCSTGPNSFFAVKYIIEAVNHKYQTQLQNPPPLEFQVLFNDQTDNDFNTLFKTDQ
ncbi:loganic acid O-methyltransferase-like [Jatropha curcas]|uniref:loganic acid O-methyltransferase-like n=1 Tax=Jatropha curcas TaxID=180498 RepID=UPI001892E638|nr:loganic acid O-methyltransferase-like [Jatropha curcas]